VKLEFRTHRTRAFLDAQTESMPTCDDGRLEYVLTGRARMAKVDLSDSPPLDSGLPPNDAQESHVRRTPLPASVRFHAGPD
jgi:hypothetical protein